MHFLYCDVDGLYWFTRQCGHKRNSVNTINGKTIRVYFTDLLHQFSPYQKSGADVSQGVNNGFSPTFQWAVTSVVGVNPGWVAVDSSGNVYLTDDNRNCIWKFTSNGTYITKWGLIRFRQRPV